MDRKTKPHSRFTSIHWCCFNSVLVIGLSIGPVWCLLSGHPPKLTLQQFDVTHGSNETLLNFYIRVDNPNKFRKITHNLAWLDVWYNNGSSNHHIYWEFPPRYSTQEKTETIYWNLSITAKPDDGDFLWETDAEKLRKREGYFYVSFFTAFNYDILRWKAKTEVRLWVDLKTNNFTSKSNQSEQLTATNIPFITMKNFDLAASSEITMYDS